MDRGQQCSVVVPVAIVSSMPVAVMHVVHVIAVRYRHMAAAPTVRMGVVAVFTVLSGFAFVRVPLVVAVQMTVVRVVHVVTVRYRHMPAALTVRMAVSGVRLMFQ